MPAIRQPAILSVDPIVLFDSDFTTTTGDPGFFVAVGDKVSVEVRTDHKTQNKNETRTMLMPALQDSVALGIGSVPEVEAVFTTMQDHVFYVWAVVSQSNPTVRKKIYAKEKQLIERFTAFEFDFNIIASLGRDPAQIINDSQAKLVYKK